VAGYRQAGYAVVGVALSMSPADEEDYLAIRGDITEAETAQRVVDRALDRFGQRSLAIEYASCGVRVNAVSLSVIKTPAHDPASYTEMGGLHPLGRVGEVADVVEGCSILSRPCSSPERRYTSTADRQPDTDAAARRRATNRRRCCPVRR